MHVLCADARLWEQKRIAWSQLAFFFILKNFSAPVRTTTHEWIRERVPMIYVFVMFIYV